LKKKEDFTGLSDSPRKQVRGDLDGEWTQDLGEGKQVRGDLDGEWSQSEFSGVNVPTSGGQDFGFIKRERDIDSWKEDFTGVNVPFEIYEDFSKIVKKDYVRPLLCQNPYCTNKGCVSEICLCMSAEEDCGCLRVMDRPTNTSITTFVGLQREYSSAIYQLIELDYDAIEAYQAAIGSLSNPFYKEKFNEFLEDHMRHTRNLTELLKNHFEVAPSGSDFKKILTQGKVYLGSIVGDRGILAAMLSNEEETNTAYERIFLRDDQWEGSREIIRQNFEDEKRHALWIQQTLSSM